MNASLLLRVSSKLRPSLGRNLNCWTAAITKKHQNVYVNTYPTILVLPDGSSLNIEYNTPRKIIVLPFNIAELSEEEQKIKIENRKPKTKVTIMEEIQDDFDGFKYVNMKKR
ncbi:PREDICTED: 39S ribosomal protein L55, mitochondrial [Polistes dominula]|uniref:39S ribosomal protein L55, mitochondrial n=1 Tax=Polistes dominula TaxID=743375 RepID=A0ABM1IRJ6_POLDO|nr:PREDICTED: 39S ribosomal protein L55, mitochondrial [Polistes dominula]